MNINVKIQFLRGDAAYPVYATDGSAAADLKACIDNPVTINPGEIVTLPTGIALSPDRDDVVALIFGRSGMGTKHGVTLSNAVGVVDSDYRGEIRVSLINRGREPYTVNNADRIAQLMFVPVYTAHFITADSLDETARGSGGFGSTGE
ncbi:MAG: dUTP diphosphatase [Eubacteriales bacterium]|jgi:dUTP pyrophosphatase|nr:dUTP diphosphatase [Eubacteriales bacterium]